MPIRPDASPTPRSPTPTAPLLAALLTALLLVVLTLSACGNSDDTSSSDSPVATADVSSEPLRVGVSPVPHGEILKFVQDDLAAQAGLTIEIKEYSDYVLPNADLADGKLDANYFQTPAFLDEEVRERDFPLVSVVGVHIEPLGLYSMDVKTPDAILAGATIAIPTEPTNEARALRLLATNGLIGLKDEDAETMTLADIAANPKKLKFREVVAAQTPRALDSADLAVINGNYALEAGLKPATDALFLEKAAGNPNVNLLVTTQDEENDPRIRKLGELLTSPEVKRFIDEKYRGGVIPAF